MKSLKFLVATIVAIFCTMAIASCSDEKDDPSVPAAKSAEGNYKGDMECSVMGNTSTFEDLTFSVKAVDESSVNVVLPAFGEAPMAMPSITVNGVKVSESSGVVTLANTEVSGQTESGKSYTCTLSGTVENNTLSIRFNLQYGAMPMPMICSSNATKQ